MRCISVWHLSDHAIWPKRMKFCTETHSLLQSATFNTITPPPPWGQGVLKQDHGFCAAQTVCHIFCMLCRHFLFVNLSCVCTRFGSGLGHCCGLWLCRWPQNVPTKVAVAASFLFRLCFSFLRRIFTPASFETCKSSGASSWRSFCPKDFSP